MSQRGIILVATLGVKPACSVTKGKYQNCINQIRWLQELRKKKKKKPGSEGRVFFCQTSLDGKAGRSPVEFRRMNTPPRRWSARTGDHESVTSLRQDTTGRACSLANKQNCSSFS